MPFVRAIIRVRQLPEKSGSWQLIGLSELVQRTASRKLRAAMDHLQGLQEGTLPAHFFGPKNNIYRYFGKTMSDQP